MTPTNPVDPDLAAYFRHAAQGDVIPPTAATVEVSLQALHAEIAEVPGGAQGILEIPQRSGLKSSTSLRDGIFGRQPLRVGIASTLLLTAAVLGTWFARSNWTNSPLAAYVYQTAPGQRSTVRLADGSTMILAPATSVTLTAQGATVTGQAFFSVVPHAASPFVVLTRNSVVRVLGTRFSVRQYPGEARSQIVVEDGRLSVGTQNGESSGSTPAVLSARMLAQVSDSGVAVRDGIATRAYTSWTEGTLVFTEVPLRDVVPELARAYSVDIRISDSTLAKRIVRTEVSVSTDPLTLILESLCRVLDARLTREGRSFVLSPAREATKPQPVAPLRHLSPQPEQQYGR